MDIWAIHSIRINLVNNNIFNFKLERKPKYENNTNIDREKSNRGN